MLLQLLNVVAFALTLAAGMIGGALLLRYVAEPLGLPSNFGLSLASMGIGGLAGFFLWVIPQMPRRKSND